MTQRIAVIPGDGIGPESHASGCAFREPFPAPCSSTGSISAQTGICATAPPSPGHDTLSADYAAVYFAPSATPGPGNEHAKGILLAMRSSWTCTSISALHPARRPAQPHNGQGARTAQVRRLRENTKASHTGTAGSSRKGRPRAWRKRWRSTPEKAWSASRGGVRPRRRAAACAGCAGGQANVLLHGNGLWRRAFAEVFQPAPPGSRQRPRTSMRSHGSDPQAGKRYEVIVTNNLFGDIVHRPRGALTAAWAWRERQHPPRPRLALRTGPRQCAGHRGAGEAKPAGDGAQRRADAGSTWGQRAEAQLLTRRWRTGGEGARTPDLVPLPGGPLRPTGAGRNRAAGADQDPSFLDCESILRGSGLPGFQRRLEIREDHCQPSLLTWPAVLRCIREDRASRTACTLAALLAQVGHRWRSRSRAAGRTARAR